MSLPVDEGSTLNHVRGASAVAGYYHTHAALQSADAPAARGRLAHALRLSVKYFLQSLRLKRVAASHGA